MSSFPKSVQFAGETTSELPSAIRSPNSKHEHSEAHVQVNPTPEVIEPATLPNVKVDLTPTREKAGEVANLLADLALHDVPSEKQTGDLPGLRPLFLTLAAKVLERKPKDPEQFIVDHLMGRQLHSNANSVVVTPAFRAKDLPLKDNTTESDGDDFAPRSRKAASLLSFEPVGDTVADRLTFGVPAGPARTVLTQLAQLVLLNKPEDPEDFLCTHLYAASSAYSVPPTIAAEDPTIASLLCDIPTGSPGYSVAMSLLSTLLAKRPTNPINYLFDHLSSRMARSSAAQSIRSSFRRLPSGCGDGVQSCSSSEFIEDDVDSTVLGDLTTQQRAAVDSYLASLLSRYDNCTSNNNNNNIPCSTFSGDEPIRPRSRRKGNRSSRGKKDCSGSPRGDQDGSHYSPYTAVHSPSALARQDVEFTVRAEYEMFRKREELRKERLLMELQSLKHEAAYRSRVAETDRSMYSIECARAASAAVAEAESYLLIIESQLARIPIELNKQLKTLAICKNQSSLGSLPSSYFSGTDPKQQDPVSLYTYGKGPDTQRYTDSIQAQLNYINERVNMLQNPIESRNPVFPKGLPTDLFSDPRTGYPGAPFGAPKMF